MDEVNSRGTLDIALSGKIVARLRFNNVELDVQCLLESRRLQTKLESVLGEGDDSFRGNSNAGGVATGTDGLVRTSSRATNRRESSSDRLGTCLHCESCWLTTSQCWDSTTNVHKLYLTMSSTNAISIVTRDNEREKTYLCVGIQQLRYKRRQARHYIPYPLPHLISPAHPLSPLAIVAHLRLFWFTNYWQRK